MSGLSKSYAHDESLINPFQHSPALALSTYRPPLA
jgi:hypothetical protein